MASDDVLKRPAVLDEPIEPLAGPRLTPDQAGRVAIARERFARGVKAGAPEKVELVLDALDRMWASAGPVFRGDAEAIAAFRGCCATAIVTVARDEGLAIAAATQRLATAEGWEPDPMPETQPSEPGDEMRNLARTLWGEDL